MTHADSRTHGAFVQRFLGAAALLFLVYCFPYAELGVSETIFNAYIDGDARVVAWFLRLFEPGLVMRPTSESAAAIDKPEAWSPSSIVWSPTGMRTAHITEKTEYTRSLQDRRLDRQDTRWTESRRASQLAIARMCSWKRATR